VEFLFKRDYARENYPAEEMGEQQNQQTFEASTAAEIPHGNNFVAQGHRKNPPYFSFP
jgi:hypothetical protein